MVIVGAGFGGLYAARALRKAPVRVTVVDRRNHHLFQPLLYQVATAYKDAGKPVTSDLFDFLQQGVFALRRSIDAVRGGEAPDEDEARWEAIARTEVCRKWWRHMSDIMPSNPDASPVSEDLREVFHLD